jgi:hypothetical protein
MSICKFIQRLLKIKAFSVRNFTFHNWFKEYWLEVKPYKKRSAMSSLQATG